MQRSEQINDLTAALVKAQADIEGARKDSTNPHFKSAYADLASVWDAVRGPLTSNGLAVMQWPRTVEGGVEIETMLSHSSGQFASDVLWLPVVKMDAQGIGSAITYGRRYALMAAVGVAPIDDDGEAAGQRPNGDVSVRPPPGHGNFVDEARRDGLVDDTREKGTLPGKNRNGKPSAAEKTKTWIDNAIQTLNLSAHTVDSLSRFQSDNSEQIEWIKDHFPAEYDRFAIALDNASQAARAKVAA